MIKSAADLHRIAKRFAPLPDYVGNAVFEQDILPPAGLPPKAYADSGGEYPIFSKSAAWCSIASWVETAPFDPDASPEVGRKLMEAAKFWGIQKDAAALMVKASKQPGIGSPEDTDFALVQDVNGTPVRRYPLGSGDTLLKSAKAFKADAHLYPLDWRRQTATNLLTALGASGTPCDESDYLHKAAGHGIASVAQLREAVTRRATMLKVAKNTPMAEQMYKAAAAITDAPASVELSRKTASLLDTLDRETGLYRQYGRGLDLPEVSCHQVLFKDAQAVLGEFVAIPGGQVYKRADLQALPPSVFTSVPDLIVTPGEFDSGHRKSAAATARLSTLSETCGRVIDQAVRAAGAVPAEFGFDIRPLLSV